MHTLKTATGKTFHCDIILFHPDKTKVYMNIIDMTLSDIAKIFTEPSELPIDGYEEYTDFFELHQNTTGVHVTLKRNN